MDKLIGPPMPKNTDEETALAHFYVYFAVKAYVEAFLDEEMKGELDKEFYALCEGLRALYPHKEAQWIESLISTQDPMEVKNAEDDRAEVCPPYAELDHEECRDIAARKTKDVS